MSACPIVLLFLKEPRPGLVKTRLAADLGEQEAVRCYEEMVNRTLEALPETWETRICYAPDGAEEVIRKWLEELVGRDFCFRAQGMGNLGERLERACGDAFSEGASGVILLGGDCPEIQRRHLEAAAEALTRGEAVVGPALDGGYWLLGLPREVGAVFRGIPWSTEKVLLETRKRLFSEGLMVCELEELEDIDELPAWLRYQERHSKLHDQ